MGLSDGLHWQLELWVHRMCSYTEPEKTPTFVTPRNLLSDFEVNIPECIPVNFKWIHHLLECFAAPFTVGAQQCSLSGWWESLCFRWLSWSRVGRTFPSPALTGSRTSTWWPTTGWTNRSGSTAWLSARGWPTWWTSSGFECLISRKYRYFSLKLQKTVALNRNDCWFLPVL